MFNLAGAVDLHGGIFRVGLQLVFCFQDLDSVVVLFDVGSDGEAKLRILFNSFFVGGRVNINREST